MMAPIAIALHELRAILSGKKVWLVALFSLAIAVAPNGALTMSLSGQSAATAQQIRARQLALVADFYGGDRAFSAVSLPGLPLVGTVVLFTMLPIICMLVAYDRLSPERCGSLLRYELVRTSVASVSLGRMVSAWLAVTMIIFVDESVLWTIAISVKEVGLGDGLLAAIRLASFVSLLALAYVAAVLALSAACRRSDAALLGGLALCGFLWSLRTGVGLESRATWVLPSSNEAPLLAASVRDVALAGLRLLLMSSASWMLATRLLERREA